MSKLFSEFKVKDMVLRNRVVMAPMCMYSATDGLVTDWHVVHYGSRANGGAGLVILEATAVSPEGRISVNDLGLWDDAQISGMARLVEAIHQGGAKAGIQLGHAGRKADVEGSVPIAPSALRFDDSYQIPVEMTAADIKRVAEAFGAAAARAHLAGFDMIELHGAHGYLINQFLSPLVNQRTDLYGGNADKRVRFLLEAIRAVRGGWPVEKPLAIRVSAEEYDEGGNHPSDVAAVMKRVRAEGVDLVHVSSGGVIPAGIKPFPGYQIPFATCVRTESGLPVIGGGLVTSPVQAEEIVANDRADLVFLARELLRNPYWPLQAATQLRAEVEWPTQYLRAKP